MDCGSCSEAMVEMVEKHSRHFYIRANRCVSLYDDIFALRGWKTEYINGHEFEICSIIAEKWVGKAYRLVIQRQRSINKELDLWEGEYTYRCILNIYTNNDAYMMAFKFDLGKHVFLTLSSQPLPHLLAATSRSLARRA